MGDPPPQLNRSTERAFQAYGRPLNLVTSFKYLVWILTALENDWPVVVGNLRNSRKKWAQLSIIFGHERSKLQVSGIFFKVMVQAVFLFGLEAWVMTPCMGRAVGGFQHRVTRWIAGRHPHSLLDVSW